MDRRQPHRVTPRSTDRGGDQKERQIAALLSYYGRPSRHPQVFGGAHIVPDSPLRLPRMAPMLALGGPPVVFLIDLVLRRQHPLVIVGVLDELAHVVTALLAHRALRLPKTRQTILGTLLGAILLDLDHVPQYLGSRILTSTTQRPVTHSLGGLGAVAMMALSFPRGLRPLAGFVAFGALTQLVRDIATGPGIAVAWPWSEREVSLPYAMYAALVCMLAAGAATTGDLCRSRPS